MSGCGQSATDLEQSFSSRKLRSVQDLSRIADEWDALYNRCPYATPFQRKEWLLAWIDAFAPRDLFAIEVRDQGSLVALAPLLIYSRNEERVLASAGGGVSDYLVPICEPGSESALLRAMCDCAGREWDVLELTDLPAGAGLVKAPRLEQHVHEHDSVSHLDLPGNTEELRLRFSKRQRANLRNAQSRMMRAGGGEFSAATEQTISEFLDDLFRLHAVRWSHSGEAGVLADLRVQSFHRACAPGLLAAGVLRVHRLRVSGRSVAALYTLWDRGTVFCYLQGYDPEFSAMSPGTQLMYWVMEQAVQAGMRKFDFLRGQEDYKQHWRAESERTYRIALRRNQLHALAAEKL